jgi:uncharacterized C2H2 Zn-finger protein
MAFVRISSGNKTCPRCGGVFPKTTKYWHRSNARSDGCFGYCRECSLKEKSSKYSSIKDRARWRIIKTKYNLSQEDFDRMFEGCGGRCMICKKSFSSERRSTTPHIDHDHETGEVRGLLCGPCNSGLGYFKDSPESLREAVRYLEAVIKSSN